MGAEAGLEENRGQIFNLYISIAKVLWSSPLLEFRRLMIFLQSPFLFLWSSGN